MLWRCLITSIMISLLSGGVRLPICWWCPISGWEINKIHRKRPTALSPKRCPASHLLWGYMNGLLQSLSGAFQPVQPLWFWKATCFSVFDTTSRSHVRLKLSFSQVQGHNQMDTERACQSWSTNWFNLSTSVVLPQKHPRTPGLGTPLGSI